uniref:Uncharacterized protein n=1 Tax=viral metagenome TaxID=1070528 RepID=A0A6M3LJR2_9ZZZZ
MDEHTPEPWAWDSRGDKTWDVQIGVAVGKDEKQCSGFIKENDDVCYIQGIAEMTGMDHIANAHRIVAAVNACKGIPTEALEAGVVADLLAACKAAMYPGDKTVREVQKQLRDAIAKARGTLDNLANIAYTGYTIN